jgi:hypothetical protein
MDRSQKLPLLFHRREGLVEETVIIARRSREFHSPVRRRPGLCHPRDNFRSASQFSAVGTSDFL